ncbi:hypothetical protein ACWTU6_29945 [Mesorhizobium sp. BHbsci]
MVLQPGFTALDPFHDDRGGVCVAALDVTVAGENGKAGAEQQRDASAGHPRLATAGRAA